MKHRDDRNQTQFDWTNPQAPAVASAFGYPDPIQLVRDAPRPLVQRLPWDFATTFPQPTDEAIDAGIVYETDTEPENLKCLHDSYCLQGLAMLKQLNDVLDARRRSVDPKTGKAPKTHAARERLKTYFSDEPARLEHTWRILIETYESAFGPEAAQAFAKCIRARHEGVPVQAESPPSQPPTGAVSTKTRRRAPTVLPVPIPLPEAIAAGHFGGEDGRPITPSAAEVRAITENHAERLVAMIEAIRALDRTLAAPVCSDSARLEAQRGRLRDRLKEAVDLFAGSFGAEAAERLEAYARRRSTVDNARAVAGRRSR